MLFLKNSFVCLFGVGLALFCFCRIWTQKNKLTTDQKERKLFYFFFEEG